MTPVGGLYGLNLIPLFRPTELTFFDLNSYAVLYFRLLRRAILASRSAEEFLLRLATEDYSAESSDERVIRRNIALKQAGSLPRRLGSSKRSFENSRQYALKHYDVTRDILANAPTNILNEAMNGRRFGDFIQCQPNLWIYCSNIFEFFFFDLTIVYPSNTVFFSIVEYGSTQILDLSSYGGGPVDVHCRIPMSASLADS